MSHQINAAVVKKNNNTDLKLLCKIFVLSFKFRLVKQDSKITHNDAQ